MMEPLCVALASAIEQAGAAFCRSHQQEPLVPYPEPIPRRSAAACADLIEHIGTVLLAECDPEDMPLASPIEVSMARALAARRGPYGLRIVPQLKMDYGACRETAKTVLATTEEAGVIFPHVQIGPYEMDFVALFKTSAGVLLAVAVECDGHDFHEKTKQQAAHDKKRDRFIAMHSIVMLRFTGSEIHYDAHTCAEEVHRTVLLVQSGPRERALLNYLSDEQYEEAEYARQEALEREEDMRREEQEALRADERKRELEQSEGYYP